MNRVVRGSFALAGLALVLLAPGCRITPEEIQRIEVENELLRQEIRTVRENCEYYGRQLELEVDEPADASGDE